MAYFVSLVLTISQMCSLVLICMAFFQFKKPIKHCLIAFGLLVMSTLFISYMPVLRDFPFKIIAGLACLIAFAQFAFKGNLRIKALCVLFGYACAFALETATVFLFIYMLKIPMQILQTQVEPFLITAATSNLLMLSLSFFLYRFRKAKKQWVRISFSSSLITCIFPVLSLLTLVILLQVALTATTVSSLIIVDVAGILVANIVLFFLLSRLVKEEQAKTENIILQHQVASQMQTVNVLLESQTQQGKITHDFKHHWNVVATLLHQKQTQEAIKYIDVVANTPLLKTDVVSCGNPIIDAVLNQKYTVAKNQNIEMTFVLNNLAAFPFSSEEIVVILANLLDNAIEACCKLKGQREIHVKMLCEEAQTVLSVRNTTDEKLSLSGEIPATTKESPWLHGFGLQNVYTILSRYNSVPAVEAHDGWFQFSTVVF